MHSRIIVPVWTFFSCLFGFFFCCCFLNNPHCFKKLYFGWWTILQNNVSLYYYSVSQRTSWVYAFQLLSQYPIRSTCHVVTPLFKDVRMPMFAGSPALFSNGWFQFAPHCNRKQLLMFSCLVSPVCDALLPPAVWAWYCLRTASTTSRLTWVTSCSNCSVSKKHAKVVHLYGTYHNIVRVSYKPVGVLIMCCISTLNNKRTYSDICRICTCNTSRVYHFV